MAKLLLTDRMLKRPLCLQEALLANAVSATKLGANIDVLLAGAINTPNATAYDRAIDSVYLTTHVGGSRLHHLIDRQHDLVGAFVAAQHALPDDTVTQEVLGAARHLSIDLFSIMGLPAISLHPVTYRASADWIQQHLGLSKAWLADLLQINGMELLGGGFSGVAVVLGARDGDSGALMEIAGSSGLAGVLAANPIAMLAGTAALYLAWRGGKADWRRLGVGSACAGTTMTVGGLLGGFSAAGVLPLAVALTLSLIAGIAVRRWLLARACSALPAAIPNIEPSEAAGERHVIRTTEQARDHLTKSALGLLRKAFGTPN